MIIKNGLVWEESGSFLTKDLHIDSDTHRIAMDSADTADDTIIDASGLYVIPGLVDIHIHGAMGCDFSDGSAEGLLKIAKYLRSCGVTAFCPYIVSFILTLKLNIMRQRQKMLELKLDKYETLKDKQAVKTYESIKQSKKNKKFCNISTCFK